MFKLMVAFVCSWLISSIAVSETYTFTKTNNKVEWTAVGTPGFLRISGEGGVAEGKVEAAAGKLSGELTVVLENYKTGIALRDTHMKERYLEIATHPKAKLVLKEQPYTEGKETTAMGDLTIKDTTKPVTVTYTVTGKKLTAKFKVKIKDYPSIGVPSYLGVTVADEVEVAVEASL